MSTNCITTNLLESVSDTSLMKLNELRLYFDNDAETKDFTVTVDDAVTLTVLGSGSIIVGGVDQGSSYDLSVGATIFTTSIDVLTLSFDKKQNITKLLRTGFAEISLINNLDTLEYMIDLTDLNLYKTNVVGDVSSLVNLTNLITLNLGYCSLLTGELTDFNGMTNVLLLSLDATLITGTLADLSVMTQLTGLNIYSGGSGNFSSLSTLTNLTSLTLADTDSLEGSFTSIAALPNLETFTISNTNLTNDIAEFAASTSLKKITATSVPLTGNIGTLPDNVTYLISGIPFLTYTEVVTRTKILTLRSARVSSGINEFLIDQAAIGAGGITTNLTMQIYYGEAITASGLAAKAVLEGFGYTITLTDRIPV